MNKLLAAIVASTFVLSSVSAFAADAGKKDELTPDQRMEMRERADRLTKERAEASQHVNTQVEHAQKAKKHHARKAKKVSRHNAKKNHPNA